MSNRPVSQSDRAPFPWVQPRPDTVLLFGCWLSNQRRDLDLPVSDVAERIPRTSAWLSAVEAGATVPTPSMLEQLGRILADKAGHPVDPAGVIKELEDDPRGALAIGLRRRNDIWVDVGGQGFGRSSDRLVPVFDQLDERDRLLTVFPLAVFFVYIGLALTVPSPLRPSFEAADVGDLTFMFLVAVVFSYFFRARLARLFDGATKRMRRGTHEYCYQKLDRVRTVHGLDDLLDTASSRGWYRPGELDYLIPVWRERFTAKAKEADLTERLSATTLVFGTGVLVLCLCCVSAGASLADIGWWLGLGISSLVVSILLLRQMSVIAVDGLYLGLLGYGMPRGHGSSST